MAGTIEIVKRQTKSPTNVGQFVCQVLFIEVLLTSPLAEYPNSGTTDNEYNRHCQPPFRAKGAEDVTGTADEQPPQIRVASLADTKLLVTGSGLVPAGHQAQVSSHLSTVVKPMRIFNRQHIRQRCDGPHPGHLP